MQRKVAKAKDGNVGKNNKGDGKVVVGKRGRKMRGGSLTFDKYCNTFVSKHTEENKEANTNILEMFNILKTIILKIKFVSQGSIFTTNTDNTDRKRAIPIIDKIIGASKIDDINQDNLKFILKFINTHMKKIIDEFNKVEPFKSTINEQTIKKLFQNILFLKIYKLFNEFADISRDITTISNIQIEKAGDKGKEHTNMSKDTPIIPTTLEVGWSNDVNTESLQQTKQTAADPQQESQTSLLLTTDAVNKGSNRSETNRRSDISVSNSKPALHLQGTRQPAKDLDMTEDKQEKAALTEPIIYDKKKTILEIKKISRLLTKDVEYKRILQYYEILSDENNDENYVRNIIYNIFWKTYNEAIEYFKGDDNIDVIRGFILYLSIENIKDIHKSNIDTIKSLSMTDNEKKNIMIQYVNDAKKLSLTYNEKFKVILEKYLGYLVSTSISDEESGEDHNLVEEAKKNLMMLIKDNTKEAEDGSVYKKFEKIRDDLDEDNEKKKYFKDALNNLLFNKINTIQDILDMRSIQKIKEIETFLSSVTDENIIKEVEKYVSVIFSFKGIDSHEKDKMSLTINEVGKELKRLFSIFLPEIEKYIKLLKIQKAQDDPERPQSESTDGSNIQQDPSNPHLLEKQNPLNVSRNSSASLRPIQSEDSELFSQLDKFRINDKNEKKMETAEFLIKFYIFYIKIIKNELLTKASTYYNENKYMEKVKQHFDYIIDKAFKILNFDVITNVEKELLVLERYQLNYTSKTFDEMRRDVNVRYGDDTTGYTLKTNALTTIALLEKNLNSFNFKCYDLLIVLFRNNKTDKIWKGGGQPRKSQRKEHINNTGAMKKKLTTKDPNANEPTAKKPTKTPKTKKPTKTPKQKEPNAKDPKQKEPTKTPKIKEPKVKKLTKTPKPKEPKAKDPKANEPITKTPKIKEPDAKKPTKTPKAKEPKPTKK
jgi:hypothetical protein